MIIIKKLKSFFGRMIRKPRDFIDKISGKEKRRERDLVLLGQYREGKYLRVDKNIDNKEVIRNGTKVRVL